MWKKHGLLIRKLMKIAFQYKIMINATGDCNSKKDIFFFFCKLHKINGDL